MIDVKLKDVMRWKNASFLKEVQANKTGNIYTDYANAFAAKAVNVIRAGLCNDVFNISPNMAVYEGQKIQLWFTLDPCVVNKLTNKHVKEIKEYIFKKVQDILDRDFPCPDTCFVDVEESKKQDRLVLLPGSFCKKTGEWSFAEFFHNNRIDVIGTGGKICNYNSSHTKERLFIKAVIAGDKTAPEYQNTMMEKRVAKLEKLAELRGFDFCGNEGTFLHIYCSALMGSGLGAENARSRTFGMNGRLKNPVDIISLRESIRPTLAKKYKYKNTTIINKLGITVDEQAKAGFYTEQKLTTDEMTAKKEQKQALISDVIRMYTEEGMTIGEIAAVAGISSKTVSKWLRDNNARSPKDLIRAAKRKEIAAQVIRFIRTGQKIDRILLAIKYGCSPQNISQEIKKSYDIVLHMLTNRDKKHLSRLWHAAQSACHSLRTENESNRKFSPKYGLSVSPTVMAKIKATWLYQAENPSKGQQTALEGSTGSRYCTPCMPLNVAAATA